MPAFFKTKSCRFWQIIFFVFLFTIIAETCMFMFIFFVLPNNPISDFASLSALPAKYIVLLVVGGFSKEVLSGYFLCYSFNEWQRLKNAKSSINCFKGGDGFGRRKED
jgi:hypothetical protein